jgi:hypothetical protein
MCSCTACFQTGWTVTKVQEDEEPLKNISFLCVISEIFSSMESSFFEYEKASMCLTGWVLERDNESYSHSGLVKVVWDIVVVRIPSSL